MPSTDQDTGTLTISNPNQLQANTMTTVRVAECRNSNSGSRRMTGRNPRPAWLAATQPRNPFRLRKLVATCSSKQKDKRYQAAHDVDVAVLHLPDGGLPYISQNQRRTIDA